jgi:exodeoxyribonuclease V alpha subunit
VLLVTNAAKAFGVDLWDVQVVAPIRKGMLGVVELNLALRDAMNPRGMDEKAIFGTGEYAREFWIGDRVMQTKNDYERGVVNGEIGVVSSISGGKRPSLVVNFRDTDGDRRVPYEAGQVRDLDLAYCSTVHKVQGAEFPAIVVVCHNSHSFFLDRGLLYTAVTRAKKVCVLAGTRKAVRKACRTARGDARRTTLLGKMAEARASYDSQAH